MSGFNQTGGSTGAGGSGNFQKAGDSTGLNKTVGLAPQYAGQCIEEIFAKLRKKAGKLSDGEKYSKATSTLDPIQDLIQKARRKHREISKDIVDTAWKTAGDVYHVIEDGVTDIPKNWDKGLV
jgi:hypothetical protein